ncbi:MAG: mechanosensitive ion channel family protein [Frisingicoccus sp.]
MPNGQVSEGRIINYTSQTQRRIEIFVGASYNAPVEDVKEALHEAIRSFPDLIQEPLPAVHVRDYQDSSIQYVIHAWVPTGLYWDAYYTLMEEIKKSFDRHHIAMDYPHMNIHMIGDENNG